MDIKTFKKQFNLGLGKPIITLMTEKPDAYIDTVFDVCLNATEVNLQDGCSRSWYFFITR